ncbi:hypothetical protein AVEN_242807-1 [Araneus ventricosus]|uniref:Uncharacterized protein n=1 Tax=Araneus ventricosus TaxID=182803 RepID=A0A4Y2PTG1_ARAVE|nr:hypothetical protein AVEN_242807-1 [Araneus ventricosus]
MPRVDLFCGNCNQQTIVANQWFSGRMLAYHQRYHGEKPSLYDSPILDSSGQALASNSIVCYSSIPSNRA